MELFGDRNVKWIAPQRVNERIEYGGRLGQQHRESIEERPLCRGLCCQQIQRLAAAKWDAEFAGAASI